MCKYSGLLMSVYALYLYACTLHMYDYIQQNSLPYIYLVLIVHSTSTKGLIRQTQTTDIFATTSTIRRTPTNIPTTIPSSAHSVSFGSTILGVFVLIAILVLM